MIAGHLVGISTDRFGSELTADLAVGDTVVQVASTIFFNETEGGVLLLNGTALAYEAFDDPDADDDNAGDDDGPTTLTLAAPSPVAADEGDRVYELDTTTGEDGDPVQELTALVTIDDRDGGDALPARVRAGLVEQLDSDLETYLGKAVELEHVRGELVLVDILGSKRTGAVRWYDKDYADASGNSDVTIRLTYRPVPDSSVRITQNGVGLNRDEWDFTDPWTILIPAGGFLAGDHFEVYYAYTDPTSRPPVPPSLTLVGVTEVDNTGTLVALPAGTQAGDLLVLAITTGNLAGSVPSCPDPRMTSYVVNHCLVAYGLADSSGSGIAVATSDGEHNGGIALAAYRFTGVLVAAHSSGAGSTMAPTQPAGTLGQQVLVAAYEAASGTVSPHGDWVMDANASGTSVRSEAWSTDGDTAFSTSPVGAWVAVMIGFEED